MQWVRMIVLFFLFVYLKYVHDAPFANQLELQLPSNRLLGRIPTDRTVFSSLEAFDFILRQIKIEHIRVFPDPLLMHGFRQRRPSHLQTPPNQHLSRRLPIFLSHRLQQRIVHTRRLNNRRVRLHRHPLPCAPVDDVRPIQPGMEFPLANTQDTPLLLVLALPPLPQLF